MRIKNLFLAAFAACLAVIGCTPEDGPIEDIIVKVNPSELAFESAAGDKTVQLTATRAWKAVIAYSGDVKDWLSVSPANGEASSKEQTVTLTVKENTGRDRSAVVTFNIGLESATLAVSQAGPGGSDEPVYFNNFDKELATQTYSGNKWPFPDQSDCWKNETGTGASTVTYVIDGNKATVRANSTSTGSGANNWFFGANSYFCVKDITLPAKTDLTFSFLGIRSVFESEVGDGKSIFDHNAFKLYVSADANKWVELQYTFEGGDPEKAWGQASTTFSVPAGTQKLSFYIPTPTEASTYRIDDIKLDVSETAGTAIDFSKGVAMTIGGGTQGGGEGGEQGTAAGTGTQTDPFNATAAIAKAKEIGSTASTDYYYIKGFVSSIKEIDTGQYGNATFYITDTKEGNTEKFYCYRVMYLDGAKFSSADQLKVGDEVVVYAQLLNYSGNTPETNAGGKIISINGGATPEGKYFGVSATNINAKCDATSASFTVTGNVKWTASIDNSAFKLDKTSGEGEATVTVSFDANTAYEPKTAKVTVSTTEDAATKSFVVTIVQGAASDPDAKFVELTKDEIVASITSTLSSNSNGYLKFDITSASGTWKAYAYCSKSKDTGVVSTAYVQINTKAGYSLTSPAFASNVAKIECVMASNQAAGRTLYAVPSSTTLPTGDYSDATYATNYGCSASSVKGAQTLTIDFTQDTKDFTIITQGGASYIESIKVYFK